MGQRKIITQQTSRTITDSLGNLIEVTESKTFKTKSTTEPFFMLYCKQLASLYNLTSLVSIKVLVKFMENATFNSGIVSLTTALRTDIMNQLSVSKSALSRAIKSLLDSNMIYEIKDEIVDKETGEITSVIRKGEYLINPEISWKGDLSERQTLLNSDCWVTITAAPKE